MEITMDIQPTLYDQPDCRCTLSPTYCLKLGEKEDSPNREEMAGRKSSATYNISLHTYSIVISLMSSFSTEMASELV